LKFRAFRLTRLSGRGISNSRVTLHAMPCCLCIYGQAADLAAAVRTWRAELARGRRRASARARAAGRGAAARSGGLSTAAPVVTNPRPSPEPAGPGGPARPKASSEFRSAEGSGSPCGPVAPRPGPGARCCAAATGPGSELELVVDPIDLRLTSLESRVPGYPPAPAARPGAPCRRFGRPGQNYN
jgi:hypothetical protein